MKRILSFAISALMVLSSLSAGVKSDKSTILGEWKVSKYDQEIDFEFTPAIDTQIMAEFTRDLQEEWQLDPDVLDFVAAIKNDKQLDIIYDNSYDGEENDVNPCGYELIDGKITLDCGSFLGLDFNVTGIYNSNTDKILITIDFSNSVDLVKDDYIDYGISTNHKFNLKKGEWKLELSRVIK